MRFNKTAEGTFEELKQKNFCGIPTLLTFRSLSFLLFVFRRRFVLRSANTRSRPALYEYTPMQIKQAVTGYGKADKKQMQEAEKYCGLCGQKIEIEYEPRQPLFKSRRFRDRRARLRARNDDRRQAGVPPVRYLRLPRGNYGGNGERKRAYRGRCRIRRSV